MTGAVLGREHWQAALARRWNRAWGDPTDTGPMIHLRHASGPGVWVVVEPACGTKSLSFPTWAEAIDHARALERLHGWPIATALDEGTA